jgi:hypothetical protein
VLLHHLDGEMVYVTLLPKNVMNHKLIQIAHRGKLKGRLIRVVNFPKYQEMKDQFRNPKIKRTIVWKEIPEKISEHGYLLQSNQ